MTESFSPNAFYDSAGEFARTALEAHHDGNHRRVALDAGTALEHLAKACLASRSPALLAELKNASSVGSVIRLLRIKGARLPAPAKIRTIGLRDALLRVGLFVSSDASKEDLETLADMRDGVVHAGNGAEMEVRIVTAFVQHAEVLVADLGRDRRAFWAGQLGVVDALLADASEKIAYLVAVKLAEAGASYLQHGTVDSRETRMARVAQRMSKSAIFGSVEKLVRCRVCGSDGVAVGDYDVEFEPDELNKDTGEVTNAVGTVWFDADRFYCGACGLRLNNPAELAEAEVDRRWEIHGVDWFDYLHPSDYDEDTYEVWRQERAERRAPNAKK